MKSNYKIYKLPNFNVLKEEFDGYKYESEDINKIIKKLEKNKGYNLRINPNNSCIIYGDFDKANEDIFNSFLQELCEYGDFEIKNISYTSSKNNTSFHWSIPSHETNPKNLKYIFNHIPNFKKFKPYIDLSVYTPHWFRLPNQTLGEKTDPHKIINGEMKDFIFDYVEETKYVWEDEKQEEPKEQPKEQTKEEPNEEEINDILDKIDPDINYSDWIYIGMSLKNIGYAFSVWNEWSSKGKKYKDKKELKNHWRGFSDDQEMGLNKIKSILKDYDIDAYNELFKKPIEDIDFNDKPEDKIKYAFNKSLSARESDIANYIIERYLQKNYICVSSKEKLFFHYHQNRWLEDIEGMQLFKYITVDYVKELIEFGKLNDKDDDESKAKKSRSFKIVDKIKGKLTFYNSLVDWIAKELLNPHFYDLCDNNIYLLGFDNGVFDTRDKTFRQGKPDDYITKSVGYNFPVKDKGYKKDIDDFLKKVFPDEELRKYTIQQQAQSLTGMKYEDIVWTHTGKGGNGKSIEQQLLKYVFGEYFLEIPSTMLTKLNKMEHNKPDPFYSELKGVRYSLAQEPSDGSKMNDSLIKIMGSKEGMKYRTLFSNKVEKLLLQTQLHIYCNNKLDFNATDGGMCRRLKVIDYVSKFTSENINEKNNIYQIDVKLSEKVKLWKEDYMMMLIELYEPEYKYKEPISVKISSGSYIDSNNDIKKFVNEHYEFTNKTTDYIFFKDIKNHYQCNKEYDQSKLKNLKEHIEKEMNTSVIEKTKIKIDDNKYKDVRSVIKGWKLKANCDDSSDDENDV